MEKKGAMLTNAGTYAVKKRKKPVQKVPKPPPPDGTKSNPSKRHRDRLNGELDKLTSLLPFSEDVRTRLDKLSVLRLSVGYLKVKSFFNATMKKTSAGWPGDRQNTFGGNGQMVSSLDGVSFTEGDLLLQALNGFVLVITAEGYVFYASTTIQDYLGFHQSDVVHQSVFELIHTDDRAMFRRQLHFALNPTQGDREDDVMQSSSEITTNIINYNPQHIPPENSSFLERTFCCRFRCLLDNSSGFLALNFHGRLKYLHGQNKLAEDGSMAHPQLALFVIATPLQPPSILEIRSKTLIFQTKHKLDFTPTGVDSRGKVVLGYTETELCMRGTGYQFIHAADMMYCADNHIRMIKTGESGFTVFRLLTKGGVWVWVQANARLVYKAGRPEFIVARQRALTNEEGEEHLRQRKLQLPFNFTTGEAVLYETMPTLGPPNMKKMPDQNVDPDSLLGSMLKQDHALYNQSNNPNSLEQAFMDSHALFSVPGDTHAWQHPIASSNTSVKPEDTVKDIMETLQQIIGDNDICHGLQDETDVDNMELKEWENILLKMNTSNSDLDLTEILANDIFSYVEDLFNEDGFQTPTGQISNPQTSQSTFADVPDCFPDVEMQNHLVAPGNQGRCQVTLLRNTQDQANFMGLANQEASPVQGMVKLTHMGPQIPLAQPIQANSMIAQPFGLTPELGNQNIMSRNNIQTFNPTLTGQYAQAQNQLRLPSQQTVNNHPQQSSMGLHHQTRLSAGPQNNLGQVQTAPAQPLQDQKALFGPTSQEGQWVSPVLNSNITDNIQGVQSVTKQPSIALNSTPANCLQGHFSLHSQNHRINSWQLPQQPQQLPTSLVNDHNHMSGCYKQTTDLHRDAHSQFVPPSTQSFMTGFRPQNDPSVGFAVPQAEQLTKNSCMFENQTPSTQINSMGYNHSGQATLLPQCQNMKTILNHGPPPSSCFYKGNPPEVNGTSAIPQDASMNSVSHKMTDAQTPENLLAQQEFFSCSGEIQMPNHTIKENGSFHFPLLVNGTTYYSDNNQANRCDF
ncbi:aryl hydrocarbon receptor 2 [Denticeps clupeoides]|uniref:Aryl hydrocarbon receptor n=1 Tax=Denticeps clupeoides TaxID=299321 RepID=A0AAY4DMT2_9TELE|nr:aryl hydrocarbon receptor-like [Denticeps clupeoides]